MTTIAPIKGMIRKRLTFDLVVSLGGGALAAYGFWYGSHIPRVQQRMYPTLTAGDAFYAKLNAEKQE